MNRIERLVELLSLGIAYRDKPFVTGESVRAIDRPSKNVGGWELLEQFSFEIVYTNKIQTSHEYRFQGQCTQFQS
jgi:hypothetical protein